MPATGSAPNGGRIALVFGTLSHPFRTLSVMEIVGLTELGERMARLAGRFGSIDPQVATQPELEWRLRAGRRLRSLIDAGEAVTTAQLEHLLHIGRPDLTDSPPGSARDEERNDGATSGCGGGAGLGDHGHPDATGADGGDGAAGGASGCDPADDDLGLPAGVGPWGEEPIRETADEYRQRLRRSKWLRHLPLFTAALEEGAITIAFIDALATVLDFVEPTVVADVVADEAGLLEVARTATRASFVRYLRLRVDAARADEGRARLERQMADSFAVLGDDDDVGMATLFAKLDPIRGQQIATVIRARAEHLHQTGHYTGMRRGQVLAQAVCDLIGGAASGGAGGVEILVLVDAVSLIRGLHDGTISETSDGLPLPIDVIRDLCRRPDATITAAVVDERGIVTAVGEHAHPSRDDDEQGCRPPGGARRADAEIRESAASDLADAAGQRPAGSAMPTGDIAAAVAAAIAAATGGELTMGRRIRLANRAQRRALRAMYRTCAHPDCSERFDDCFIHHIVTWEDGGPTDLDLLVPLCGRHHHQIHDARWRLTIDAERTMRWYRPDGSVDSEVRHRPLAATHPARDRRMATGTTADTGVASGPEPNTEADVGRASRGLASARGSRPGPPFPGGPVRQRSRGARGSPPDSERPLPPLRPSAAAPPAPSTERSGPLRLFDPPAA